MLEHDPLVPRDLRSRLEIALLKNLALMRTLDRGFPLGPPISRADIHALGELDADCAEALWALDQSAKRLDVPRMVADTLASLDRLPAVHQRLRSACLDYPQDLEREILGRLDPAEAYSQIPGRDVSVRPSRPVEPPLLGRNAPCPCGSGRKYKKCCLLSPSAAASSAETKRQPTLPRPRYHFEHGSYGGKGRFVPSIACKRESSAGERVLHFVLVKPQAVFAEEDDASAAAADDLSTAFAEARSERPIPDHVGHRLRSAGYLIVEDPRMARD